MAAYGRITKDTLLTDITSDSNATLGDLMDALESAGYHIGGKEKSNGLLGTLQNIEETLRTIDRTVMDLAQPWAKADEAASKYAKTIGLTKRGMDDLRRSAIGNSITQHIGFEFDMSADELIDAQMRYAQSVGRTIKGSVEDQRNLAAIKKVYGDSGVELLSEFEKFGLSITSSGEHLGKMFANASKNGLTLERYTKNVQQGLAMAQTYTFRGGLKGMEEMAKRATAIRMEMSQISSFANSFSDIEKAIQNSAKIQVLGGPFAAGADALGLLNDSLNGIEDVQKRMEQFTKGMATFNKTTGEVEVSQFNKMRLRAFAEATGQDYSKLMETVNRQGAVEEIKAQMAMSSNVSAFDEDMRELIQNTATFKDGKAGVTIDGKFKTLDEISAKDRNTLIAQSRTDSENIQSIAKDVRSILDLRNGVRKEYENLKAGTVGRVVGNTAKGATRAFADGGVGLIKGPVGDWLRRNVGQIVSTAILGLAVAGGTALAVGEGTGRIGRLWGRGGGGGISSSSRIGGRATSRFVGNAKDILGRVTGSSSRIVKGGRRLKDGTRILSNAGKAYTVSGGRLLNEAGKAVTGAAKDAVLKTGSAVGKSSKTIRKAKQITNLIKAGKGAKVAASGLKAAGKRIPIAGALLSAGIEAYSNREQFKDKATRGSAVGKTAGAGVGAAIGAGLGSLLGPLGTIAGGIAGEFIGKHIGGFVGKIQDNRVSKNRSLVDSQLGKLGVERNGDYSVSRLKDIDKALQTGRMSNDLRKKLLKEGDADIVNQINAVKDKKKADKEAKKEKRQERRDKILDRKAEIAKNKFGTANFEIGTAYFGGKGLIGSGLPTERVRGKKETGKNAEVESTFKKLKQEKNERRKENETSSKPIDVNINGTIKLEAPNGQSIDLMKELKKSPQLMSQLTEMIVKEMNRRSHGAYVEDRTRGDNFV